MEKLKNLLKGKTFKTCLTALSIMVLSAPMAFASGTGTGASAGMTTAMEGVKTEFEATVAGIAPIAVGIIAIFLVWKYGMQFFTSLTNKGAK